MMIGAVEERHNMTLSWQVEREQEIETQVEPEFELIWITVFVSDVEEGK